MIHWPAILAPLSVGVDPVPRTLAGTPSVLGLEQRVASSAGVWAITYTGIAITGAARIKTWRAIQAQAEGRANRLVVPVRDRSFLRPGGRGLAEYGDDATFGDGSTFTGDIDATAGAAARGAVTLTIAGPVALLDAGQHFSIADRLYRIKSIDASVGGTVVVKVWPPLRAAVLADTPLNFARPVCTVRLASDSEMDLPLVALQSAAPTVRFTEDVS